MGQRSTGFESASEPNSNRKGGARDYDAWRDRLINKASKRREDIGLAPEVAARGEERDYWDSSHLFNDTQRKAADNLFRETFTGEVHTCDEDPQDHLAILDLRENASPEEVLASYRALAKLHHPDRWTNADPETQAFHARCMQNINEAYEVVQAKQRA